MNPHKIVGFEESLVHVPAAGVMLEANLGVPYSTLGVVVFAHGRERSRHQPATQHLARDLRIAGFATLLLDLLLPEEVAAEVAGVGPGADVDLLTDRLLSVTAWLGSQPPTRMLRVGYFGAGIGTAAALVAAAMQPTDVFAVVSYNGRPDLAGRSLRRVRAPTLLMVGGDDALSLECNEQAIAWMHAPAELAIVPGVSHLDEDPVAPERVASIAMEWFSRHVVRGIRSSTLPKR